MATSIPASPVATVFWKGALESRIQRLTFDGAETAAGDAAAIGTAIEVVRWVDRANTAVGLVAGGGQIVIVVRSAGVRGVALIAGQFAAGYAADALASRAEETLNLNPTAMQALSVGREVLGVLVARGKGNGLRLGAAPKSVSHPSQRAARRAAEREAGMGRHGGREQLPDKPLKPGSKSPQGDPGVRTEVRSTDTGRTVHHDPYGHRDGDIPPHYGVDNPGGTTHHTYPSTHDPQTNR